MKLPHPLPALIPVLKRPLQVAAVAAVLVAGYSLCLPNRYRSEARILPADARGSGMGAGLSAAAAAVGIAIPGQESADAAYVDILNSRWLRESLLETPFTFRSRSWRFGALWERRQTLAAYLEARNTDQALGRLKGCITVQRDIKSKLLTVSVETTSPELSQQAAQRVIKLLDEFVVRKAMNRGAFKAAFAEKRLGEARAAMAEAEADFRAFMEGNRNWQMSADPAVRLKGSRMENELRLRTQLVTTLALAREQALMEEKNDMPILNVLDAGNLPQDKSGPARSGMVLGAFLLAGLGSALWLHREALGRWLKASEKDAEG